MSRTTDATVRTDASPPGSATVGRVRGTIGWILVAVAAGTAIVFPLSGLLLSAQIVAFAGVLLAVVQGGRRYGALTILAFFVLCYVISTFWESFSIATGFPFGDYVYTLMPQWFNVPILIGITYFGIGWVSWMTVNALLDRADERLDLRTRAGRVNVVALPVISGAVMTMWDVGADSLISTVRGVWLWEDGGGLFGVPWTNYLGWWFVTWCFFQAWTLILAARQTRAPADATRTLPAVSHLQPVLVYGSFAIIAITTFIAASDPAVSVDPTGVEWDTNALNESLMIINIFTMIPIALLAIMKIARGDLARR
jgi:uncharacterized membrane protein